MYKLSRILFYFKFKVPFERIYDSHHLNHFSKKSLQLLFKNNNMNIKEEIFTSVPLRAIDVPGSNYFIKKMYLIALFFIRFLERIFNNSYLQTICTSKNISNK